MSGGEADGCRATLVVHRNGSVVCLDDDCVVEEELHVLVVPCDEIHPGCCDEPR